MSNVHPDPEDPTAPRWPFDSETVKLHRGEPKKKDESPSLAFQLRRHIHTLSFLSPTQAFILALALLATLHAAGLLLFTRGFLLTRLALLDINDCNPISPSGNLEASCSLPPTHSKMVFLVIDALRADFILPVTTSPSPFYHNHVPLPSELSAKHPTHSFLSHFIADAPTTTLQRLKGLTTGSLPTFIDAGSNFAGEKVGEDNWLGHAKRAGKRIAMVGDDTWLSVFPTGEGSVWEKGRTWPYDSFNVEDLDTVDAGVAQHLLPLLDENLEGTGTWDIIIAHGLGLDHAGHRFGAEHSETTRKLRETQQLLEDVVARLDSDTLLVVIGDHGMTDRGDHGGDSWEEVDAALWVYSKGAPLTDAAWFTAPTTSSKHPLADLFNASSTARELGDRMEITWAAKGVEAARSVGQVDIVPTIALLLGLPVPFGNLGLVIPELFYHSSSLPVAPIPAGTGTKVKPKRGFFGLGAVEPSQPTQREHETLSPLQTLLQAHLLTASQLSHYLTTYTSSSSGADLRPSLPELHFTLALAQSAYLGAHAPGATRSEMELRALGKFWTYSRKAREKARGIWARFDANLIGAGLAVWAGSVVVAARLFAATKNGNRARFIVGQAIEGTIIAGWVTLALWLVSAFELVGGLSTLLVVFILATGAEIGAISAPLTPTAVAGSFGLGRSWSWRDLVPLVPLTAHCALFASNSFTVFEDSSVLFLLSSLLVISLLKALSAPEARLRKRLLGFGSAALVGVRLMAYSTICREEQIPKCHATFHLGAGSYPALVVVGLALVAAWFIPTALRASLALSASDTGIAPAYIGGGVRLFLVLAVAYWAVDWCIAGLSLDAAGVAVATTLKTGIARVVQTGAIMGSSLVWWFSPVPLQIHRKTTNDASGKAVRTQVNFIGFANAFGSSYLLFFATVFTLIFLVSPPPAQLVLAVYLAVLLCLLEVFDSERDVEHLRTSFNAASIEDLLKNSLPTAPPHQGPNFTQISTLALLSHLAFFTTGHQASLSTIQWGTAFIGFPTLVYPFSPLLVILNTFGPYLLSALALPLFVFWNLSPTLRDQPPLALLRNLLRSGVAYGAYHAVVALAAAAAAAYFRRHLMVWKVFAPRFMLGATTVLVTDVVLLGAMAWGAGGTVAKAKATFGTRVVE